MFFTFVFVLQKSAFQIQSFTQSTLYILCLYLSLRLIFCIFISVFIDICVFFRPMSARDHVTKFCSINSSSSFLETRRQMKQFRRRIQIQRSGEVETENALVITTETRAGDISTICIQMPV